MVRRSRDEEVAIYEVDEFDELFDRGEDVTSALGPVSPLS
jgi:hypothetical protein